jgi:hypothetical protein
MKKIIKLSILFLLTNLFFSCDKNLEISVQEYDPKLVVNCFFNPDENWTVHVSQSLALLDTNIIIGYDGLPNVIDPITNANVLIYEENNKIDSLHFVWSDTMYNLGYYISYSQKPEVSKNYTIKVTAPGFKNIYAEDNVPEYAFINSVSIVDSINITDTTFTGYLNNWYYNLEIDIHDEPQIENYYHIGITYNQSEDSILNYEPFGSTDPVILADAAEVSIYGSRIVARGQYVNEGEFAGFGAIFSDRLFKDRDYTMKIKYIFCDEYKDIDKFTVRLTALSESFYKYLLNISQKINAEIEQNPFAEPIIIYTNVNNGAGIFAGYSTAKIPQNQWIKNLK